MRNRCLLPVMLISAWVLIAEHARATTQPRYYRSNAAAMLLEEISAAERDEHTYLLTREHPAADREVRTLYREGEEVLTRRLWYRDGELYREEELRDRQVTARRELGEGRRLLAEEWFRDGELELRLEYSYREHRIERIRAYDREGSPLYEDHYMYRPDGRLRTIARTQANSESPADGPEFYAEFRFVNGALRSEWHEYGEYTASVRYDGAGRLAELQSWQGEQQERVLEYRYQTADPGSPKALERTLLPGEEREELKRFDQDGRLRERTVKIAGEVVQHDELEYEDGLLRTERQARADVRRIVRYEYDSGGTLHSEAWVRDGKPERLRRHEGEDRVIELHYRDGEPVLRVEYRGEQRVREEVIRDGEVVRVRNYVQD